jgi:hypothetical protein
MIDNRTQGLGQHTAQTAPAWIASHATRPDAGTEDHVVGAVGLEPTNPSLVRRNFAVAGRRLT